jgi:hypothetical protein
LETRRSLTQNTGDGRDKPGHVPGAHAEKRLVLQKRAAPRRIRPRILYMQAVFVKAILFAICCPLWLAAYAGLLFARLNVYEDFYKSSYSYFYHLFGITEMATLYAALIACVSKTWAPSRVHRRYLFMANVAMIVFAITPPISPFEFFLFRHRNEGNPFATCRSDCAVIYDPGAYQLGMNDTLDVFIIYSPLDRFGACIGPRIDPQCELLVSNLDIDKSYGINGRCEYAIQRLSKANYYSLTSHNCR